MARKRANTKTTEKKEVPKPRIQPLHQAETKIFEELVNLSNTYAQLRKQSTQYEYVLRQLEDNRTNIQKDNIKLPIMMQLGGNSFYMESDKKKVLAELDKQIDTIKNSLKGIKGQVEQRENAFIEAGIRLQRYAEHRFGVYKPKQVLNERREHKDEKVLFEAELDELLKNPEVQEEFKKKKAEAVAKNKGE